MSGRAAATHTKKDIKTGNEHLSGRAATKRDFPLKKNVTKKNPTGNERMSGRGQPTPNSPPPLSLSQWVVVLLADDEPGLLRGGGLGPVAPGLAVREAGRRQLELDVQPARDGQEEVVGVVVERVRGDALVLLCEGKRRGGGGEGTGLPNGGGGGGKLNTTVKVQGCSS